MVNQVYPDEVQLNKPKTTYTEVPSLNLHLCIGNGFVSSKNYDKRRDEFNSDIRVYTCIKKFRW